MPIVQYTLSFYMFPPPLTNIMSITAHLYNFAPFFIFISEALPIQLAWPAPW